MEKQAQLLSAIAEAYLEKNAHPDHMRISAALLKNLNKTELGLFASTVNRRANGLLPERKFSGSWKDRQGYNPDVLKDVEIRKAWTLQDLYVGVLIAKRARVFVQETKKTPEWRSFLYVSLGGGHIECLRTLLALTHFE